MKYIYRCIDCQLTITCEPDARVPSRTLEILARSPLPMRCPVCMQAMDREGERAPRERRHLREVKP